MELYKNIKELRLKLGLTQQELAQLAGYADKSMIAKIEKGIVDLPLSKIHDFARVLHTTPSDLMGWEDTAPLPYAALSEDRQELLGIYDTLNDRGKDAVIDYAKYTSTKDEYIFATKTDSDKRRIG